jgi:ribosomal protein S18 acetylase RimI-like enzyme
MTVILRRKGGYVFHYLEDAALTAQEAINLYVRSTLGERRPIQSKETFEAMLRHADITITAWDGYTLVGIARTLTEFAYVAYLADLAVDQAYQRLGIGKNLIQETQSRLGSQCMIVLLAAPKANEYYEHIGFEHNPRAWTLKK